MENLIKIQKLDRTVLTAGTLKDKDDVLDYWLSRPVEERLNHIELLRQINYGYDACAGRLQRILELVEFKPR